MFDDEWKVLLSRLEPIRQAITNPELTVQFIEVSPDLAFEINKLWGRPYPASNGDYILYSIPTRISESIVGDYKIFLTDGLALFPSV